MPTQGRYVDALDNENNLLYPKTAAAQVIYQPGKTAKRRLDELGNDIIEITTNVEKVTNEVVEARDDGNMIHLSLKKRLDSMSNKTDKLEDEIESARFKDGVGYPDLSTRLNKTDEELKAIEKEINDAKGNSLTLGDRINEIVSGNDLTLEEIVQARNGEVDLDTRLDKMQNIIVEANTELTKAKIDDLGVTHPTLQVRLDRMRQDAQRTDTEVIQARTRAKYPDRAYATLKDRLDAMDVDIDQAIGGGTGGVTGNFLSITGGTMQGSIDMNGNAINNTGNILIKEGSQVQLSKTNGGTSRVINATSSNNIFGNTTHITTIQGSSFNVVLGSSGSMSITNADLKVPSGSISVGEGLIPSTSDIGSVGTSTRAFNTVYAGSGGFQQASDQNKKEDIKSINDESYFEMIKGTEVKSYLYKMSEDETPRKQSSVDESELNIGILAQEMSIFPESKYVLNHDTEAGYSVNLYNYSASLHSALRHLIKQHEELQKEFVEFKELVNQKLGVI